MQEQIGTLIDTSPGGLRYQVFVDITPDGSDVDHVYVVQNGKQLSDFDPNHPDINNILCDWALQLLKTGVTEIEFNWDEETVIDKFDSPLTNKLH